MRPIDAKPKTIGDLLHNGRYAIDDYQREYKWTTKQVEELLNDLSSRFAFNLDVDERTPAMEALFRGDSPDESDGSESVRNIVGRYGDIERLFPEAVPDEAMPWFVDWLIEKVTLVEITAFSDDDAYTIFETMNDRGLSLTPIEMLKGWLLANIKDDSQRAQAGKIWMERVGTLQELGKGQDTDAFKAWLRSQYATSIRDRKKNAKPRDFDRLGTEFHRWLREHKAEAGLTGSSEFFTFVHRDLTFYTRWYERLRNASLTLTPGLEPVFYLARYGFTLQFAVLLAPLVPDEPEATSLAKIELAANYLDILLTRRLWHRKRVAYSTMQYAMFLVMHKARRLSVADLSQLLIGQLDEDGLGFTANANLWMHQQNRYFIHQILARLTDHVERQSGLPGRFVEYVTGKGTARYEVEHIWANHPERHTEEFPQAADFLAYRNRIGGLLLLPKSFNASFGDLPYGDKVGHYLKQNILAQSLHPGGYERNPGFLAYVKRSGLPFVAMARFDRAALDARQELVRLLAEEVWSPTRLEVAG